MKNHFPKEVLDVIYNFDSTYRKMFARVLQDISHHPRNVCYDVWLDRAYTIRNFHDDWKGRLLRYYDKETKKIKGGYVRFVNRDSFEERL